MVAVRKYVLKGRVFVGLPVLALGELGRGVGRARSRPGWRWRRPAASGWRRRSSAGRRRRGPSSLLTSWVAFGWPEAGMALSSSALTLKVTPGTVLFLLASSTAIWTPPWMPRPVAEFAPVSGASTPMMISVFLPPLVALAAVVARAAGGEGECSGGEHGGEYDQRTLSHDESFPWRGRLCWGAVCLAGPYWGVQGRAETRPAAR